LESDENFEPKRDWVGFFWREELKIHSISEFGLLQVPVLDRGIVSTDE
jgi:hypothetical protein